LVLLFPHLIFFTKINDDLGKKNPILFELFYLFESVVFLIIYIIQADSIYNISEIQYITIVIIYVSRLFALTFDWVDLILNMGFLYWISRVSSSLLSQTFWDSIAKAFYISVAAPITLGLVIAYCKRCCRICC